MTHAARKAERKRNRSKVSPQSTSKQAKAKLDYSDTPTMASSSMPVSSVTSTPGSRILSLGDIESRIARDHKDIKLTERDSNMIKVMTLVNNPPLFSDILTICPSNYIGVLNLGLITDFFFLTSGQQYLL